MFQAMVEKDMFLRLFEQRHTDELSTFFNDNRSYLEGEMSWLARPFSTEDVQAFIRESLERFATNQGFRAGIWWREQLVGGLSLHSIEWEKRKASLGYWLGAAFQGYGIITNSCRVAIQYAFTDLRLDRLEIQSAANNERSWHVAERLGFQHEGRLRQAALYQGQLVDLVVYGLLRSEWKPIQAGN